MMIQFIYEFDGSDFDYTISGLRRNMMWITPRRVTMIKRKNANNNRQTSWWKKVVLFQRWFKS